MNAITIPHFTPNRRGAVSAVEAQAMRRRHEVDGISKKIVALEYAQFDASTVYNILGYRSHKPAQEAK